MGERCWMRQCTLYRHIGGVSIETVSWIPEEFAVKNNIIKLKDGEKWEDGWKIVFVGARKESVEVHERSRDHLKQRKASDV